MPALAYRTKLPRPDDPDILGPITEEIAQGVPMKYAAINAGVSEWTAYHWRMEGERELQEQGDGELGSRATFAQAVKEAEARCVSEQVSAWQAAPANGFAKHATLLERRFPQDFGRRDRLDVDQRSVSISVNVSLDQLPPDALPALQEAIRRIQDEGTPPPPALTEGSTHTDSAPAPGTGT